MTADEEQTMMQFIPRTYEEFFLGAFERVESALTATRRSIERGDEPERVQEYLKDVERWTKITLEDLRSDNSSRLMARKLVALNESDKTDELAEGIKGEVQRNVRGRS